MKCPAIIKRYIYKTAGSWGYEPKDNDKALDLRYSLGDTINNELENIFNKGIAYEGDKWSRCGLIQILLQAGFFIKLDIANKALQYINELLLDEEYISAWDDPDLFLKAARKFKVALEIEIGNTTRDRICNPKFYTGIKL